MLTRKKAGPMRLSSIAIQVPEVAALVAQADYVDEKCANGAVSLREFIATMLSHQPAWITFLFRVRSILVRLIGLRHKGIPRSRKLKPETLPMQPGGRAAFFTVCAADEERYWIGEATDKHLNGAIAVVVEERGEGQRCFHVLTIVHYNKFSGPLYFNLIRPFHHLVVGSMVQAGVKGDVV